MVDVPAGPSIKDLTFDEIQKAMKHPGIAGWVYPKRNISSTVPLFSTGQRAALTFYGWFSIAMVVVGVILPLAGWNWAWALLVPGAVVAWRANRKSMEQFFLENIASDRKFYDAIRESSMAAEVNVVFKGVREPPAIKDVPMSEKNHQAAEDRARIVSIYGKFVETLTMTPDEIADIKQLPFRKEEILDAIFLELIREPNEAKRSALEVGAILLANFQDGVGDRPLSMLGFPLPPEPSATSDEELLDFAEKIAAGSPNRQLWEEYNARVTAELEKLRSKIKAAEQLRQAMPESKKREILG